MKCRICEKSPGVDTIYDKTLSGLPDGSLLVCKACFKAWTNYDEEYIVEAIRRKLNGI